MVEKRRADACLSGARALTVVVEEGEGLHLLAGSDLLFSKHLVPAGRRGSRGRRRIAG